MELQVIPRTIFGKATKILRKQGLIPAELYGHGVSNLHLSVDKKEFETAFKEAGGNTVIMLRMDGTLRPVVVHDVSRDNLKGNIRHIDFYEVRMNEKMRARVRIELVGEAPAVREKGGLLNKTMVDIEVEALPGDFPHRFTVDIGSLTELNQSIYIRDIPVPHGVKILIDPGTAVVSVMPPQEEEIKAEPVDISAVKVETEEKKAEREKESAGSIHE